MTKQLLIIVCLLTSALSFSQIQFDSEGLRYEINRPTTEEVESAIVLGRTSSNVSKVITIPGTIANEGIIYQVTRIAEKAFVRNQLTKVMIPENITSIGAAAFAGNKLTSIKLRNRLKSIVIPDNVTSIEFIAFEENQLDSVTLGNGIKTIGLAAFINNNLTSVVIPNSVTTIARQAFDNNQLTNITLGSGIASMCVLT